MLRFLIGLAIVASGGLVWACDCVPPEPAEALKASSAVFVGKVTDVKEKEGERHKTVTMVATKGWKGIKGPGHRGCSTSASRPVVALALPKTWSTWCTLAPTIRAITRSPFAAVPVAGRRRRRHQRAGQARMGRKVERADAARRGAGHCRVSHRQPRLG